MQQPAAHRSLAVPNHPLRLCLLRRLVEAAQAATETEFNSGQISMKTLFVHKYADAVPVDLRISMGGTDTQRLWVVDIKPVGQVATDMMVSSAVQHVDTSI
jgi:hypothetical protein